MMSDKIRVLLLTNRDSDNVGDQIIEGCDISLLHAAFRNLGYRKGEYEIKSRAAGIITKKYLRDGNPELLNDAIAAIRAADILVFGGAPLFNYRYQAFYRRTIKTLEIAQEHGVPVIFSSIGIESYDEENPKCMKLKKALNLSCVKQITTRDDLDALARFVSREGIRYGKVSDPALFIGDIFREPTGGLARRLARRVLARWRRARSGMQGRGDGKPAEKKKTIGLVVVRKGIFEDNGIDFPESAQMAFWLDVVDRVTAAGYDYKLFTTGHFSDEIFLDYFCRESGVPASKCIFNINSPEELIKEIRSCKGIIAYRLHASITAISFGIPSVGLVWNRKLRYFYEDVGLPERMLERPDWDADKVFSVLDKAMEEGASVDPVYKMTVYDTLFAAMRDILKPGAATQPFGMDELKRCMPTFPHTTRGEYSQKLSRKFKRIYDNSHKYME
jgi:polysaccharide pyruvyl transferase WcaK-like protein